jgi:GNAT superfamily N-acetyltransferase
MDLPPVTIDLAHRIHDTARRFYETGLRRVEALPGNPLGFLVRRIGETTCVLSRMLPVVEFYNRVFDLRREEVLLEILPIARAIGAELRVETHPATLTPELGEALARHGLYLEKFTTALYTVPLAEAEPVPAVVVRRVPHVDFDRWFAVMADGFGITAPGRSTAELIRRAWLCADDTQLYWAEVDGTPASVLALFVSDDLGRMDLGTTLPPYRNRGCLTALIRHARVEALRAGCSLIGAETLFGTTSQNVLERNGFRIAYTKGIWLDRQQG